MPSVPSVDLRPWIAIQRNRSSGSGARAALLHELIIELKRTGYRTRLFASRTRFDAFVTRIDRCSRICCAVAAGGDGTVADLVNRHPGLPVAILPLGTENLLAKYLGIRPSGRQVAEMIVAGQKRCLDLGRAGERTFLLMASVGFDADVVRRLASRRRGNITHFSYIQPILESLRTYKHPEFRIQAEGSEHIFTAREALFVNLPAYAFGLSFAAAARGDDGRLDARLFQHGSRLHIMRYVMHVLRNSHEALSDVVSVSGRRFRIESDEPAPVQVDGDVAGWTPLDVSVLPGALTVLVPPASSHEYPTDPHCSK